MTKKDFHKIIFLLVMILLSFSVQAAVQNPGLVNEITAPTQVLVGSSFSISNHLNFVDVDWNSFQLVQNGNFVSGNFSDFNGLHYRRGGSILGTLYNGFSSVDSCPDDSTCAKIITARTPTTSTHDSIWPKTYFSHKDKVRFDVNAASSTGGSTLGLAVYSFSDLNNAIFTTSMNCQTAFQNCFLNENLQYSVDGNPNPAFNEGQVYNDVNFVIEQNNWDNNILLLFEAGGLTASGTETMYIDNIEKATAYNTFSFPNNADCNAFFVSAQQVDMPYTGSTYDVNFTAPMEGGIYTYAVKCQKDGFTSYTENTIQVNPIIDANTALVQDPSITNIVTEPDQPTELGVIIGGSTFTLKNKVRLTDLNWMDFQLVKNGTSESGQLMDFNGGTYTNVSGTDDPLTFLNPVSNSSANCLGSNYCLRSRQQYFVSANVGEVFWPKTKFSYKDKIRFDTNFQECSGGSNCTRLGFNIYSSAEPVFGRTCFQGGDTNNDCFPFYNLEINADGSPYPDYQEGTIVYDLNFVINRKWDNNMTLVFEAIRTNGTIFNMTATEYFDNIERAKAYNTTSFITNADCNASFNGSAFSPMTFNGSTQEYEINFSSPLLGGDYNYAISCRSGIYTDYDQGLISFGEKTNLCKPIINNGSTGEKIDVVFVGSGFPDLNSFSNTIPDFIDYNETGHGLMSLEPFNDDANKTLFNFWKVDSLQTMNLITMIPTTGSVAVNNCPFADQIVLLSVEPRFGSFVPAVTFPQAHVFIGKEYLQDCNAGTANCTYPWPLDTPNILNPFSYLSCQGLGKSGCNLYGENREVVVRTFVHEFGHSFGGLTDEYQKDMNPFVDTNSTIIDDLLLPGFPNCDNATCNKWLSSVPGSDCLKSCKFDNWKRAYQNTIMDDQYKEPYVDFREVNERQINKQIEKFNGSVGGDSTYSYIIDLNYSNGSITLNSVKLVNGSSPNNISFDANYHIKLVTDSNTNLYDQNFEFPLEIEHLLPENSRDVNGILYPVFEPYETLSSTSAILVLPYSGLTKFLQVFNSTGSLVFSADISNVDPISYTLGYGGNRIVTGDLNVSFSLISQPTGKLVGEDYNIILGSLNDN